MRQPAEKHGAQGSDGGGIDQVGADVVDGLELTDDDVVSGSAWASAGTLNAPTISPAATTPRTTICPPYASGAPNTPG